VPSDELSDRVPVRNEQRIVSDAAREPDDVLASPIPEDSVEDDCDDSDDWDEENWDETGTPQAGPGTELSTLLNTTVTVDDPVTIPLLRNGALEIHGRMPWSSNGTYLVSLDDGSNRTQGIYKPQSGERPLWDFPNGLWQREVATYELAEWLDWHVVPPTIIRRDGPLGIGSLQWFVPSDYTAHYFTMKDEPVLRRGLEQICLLDIVANNTDRKGGHCLLGEDGRVWAIDNGLSFHAEFKLRTVLWDFAGESIPTELIEGLGRLLDDGLPPGFVELLDPFERDAIRTRANAVISGGVFPSDPTGRRYPWPLV